MILEDSSTTHGLALDNLLVNEYSVVLARAPQSTVRFTVKPVELSEKAKNSGAKGIQVKSDNGDWEEDGITLFFTKDNWYTKQTVKVRAVDDDYASGRRKLNISHKVSQDGAGEYDGITARSVSVVVYDNDSSDVIIVPTNANGVADNQSLVAEAAGLYDSDRFAIALTKEPSGDINFLVKGEDLYDQQLSVSNDNSTWTNELDVTISQGSWNSAKAIYFKAKDDSSNESIHYSKIILSIDTNDEADYLNLSLTDVNKGLNSKFNGIGGDYSAEIVGNNLIVEGPKSKLVEITQPGSAKQTITAETNYFHKTIILPVLMVEGETWTVEIDNKNASYTVETNNSELNSPEDVLKELYEELVSKSVSGLSVQGSKLTITRTSSFDLVVGSDTENRV